MCKDGFYNSFCNATCGQCLDGQSCDKNNGTCIKGCQPHYKQPMCTGRLHFFSIDLNMSDGATHGASAANI